MSIHVTKRGSPSPIQRMEQLFDFLSRVVFCVETSTCPLGPTGPKPPLSPTTQQHSPNTQCSPPPDSPCRPAQPRGTTPSLKISPVHSPTDQLNHHRVIWLTSQGPLFAVGLKQADVSFLCVGEWKQVWGGGFLRLKRLRTSS